MQTEEAEFQKIVKQGDVSLLEKELPAWSITISDKKFHAQASNAHGWFEQSDVHAEVLVVKCREIEKSWTGALVRRLADVPAKKGSA